MQSRWVFGFPSHEINLANIVDSGTTSCKLNFGWIPTICLRGVFYVTVWQCDTSCETCIRCAYGEAARSDLLSCVGFWRATYKSNSNKWWYLTDMCEHLENKCVLVCSCCGYLEISGKFLSIDDLDDESNYMAIESSKLRNWSFKEKGEK